MMKCPDCGTRCVVKDSEVRAVHVWRQYRCVCGLSFHTAERVLKKLGIRGLTSRVDGKRKRLSTPEVPKPVNGWFRQ